MDARWDEYNRVLNLRNDAVDPSPSYLPDIFSFGVIEGSGEEGEYTAPDISPECVANNRLVYMQKNCMTSTTRSRAGITNFV